MRRATQKWHDSMRSALDSGTPPPPWQRRGRRAVIAFLGILSACVAVTAYASRGPAPVPKDPLPVQPVARAIALKPEQTKRSYTAARPTPEPSPSLGQPPAAQLTTVSAQQQLPTEDPVSTGALGPAALDDARRSRRVEKQKPAKRPAVREAQLHSDTRQVGSSQSQVRTRGSAKRVESHDRADVRQARALRRESPPGRVYVAAAAPVTVCLYFVVCF